MRFEIWKNNPSMMDHLNARFDPRFSACCGCNAELQGDEVLYQFRDSRPGTFPLCLDCIDGALVGEGQDRHADPVKMPALLERVERRAVELLEQFDRKETRADR